MKTYRVRREWTVVMESWIDVEADSLDAACEIAIDSDYDDQRIADCSDGPTYIGKIVEDGTGLEVEVPPAFREDHSPKDWQKG